MICISIFICYLHESHLPYSVASAEIRHLLEANGLVRQIFDTINGHWAEHGLMMREGTIVDVTLIAEPPSTRNQDNSAIWKSTSSER